eukprot:5169339-Pleurochrysis_carterae.AAC.1
MAESYGLSSLRHFLLGSGDSGRYHQSQNAQAGHTAWSAERLYPCETRGRSTKENRVTGVTSSCNCVATAANQDSAGRQSEKRPRNEIKSMATRKHKGTSPAQKPGKARPSSTGTEQKNRSTEGCRCRSRAVVEGTWRFDAVEGAVGLPREHSDARESGGVRWRRRHARKWSCG